MKLIFHGVAWHAMPGATTRWQWLLCRELLPDQQLLRSMKLVAIFITVFCLQAGAGVNGQVTLSVKDVTLDKVFEIIEKQAAVSVVFNWDDLKGTKKVTLQFANAPYRDVLDKALEGQGLAYEVKGGRSVFVFKRRSTAMTTNVTPGIPAITFRGRLVNPKKEPVVGATVQVRGTNKMTTSDDKGEFILEGVNEYAVLIITSVNYLRKEFKINNQHEAVLEMSFAADLKEVEVVYNTGYQHISKDRSTGSFVHLDSQLINRRVSDDILSRIEGVAAGVLFNPPGTSTSSTGINIRGDASVSPFVNRDPLIVVDNFPYTGNISNINPNDIASITILKDAAAASIWGARAGNGVIVITTKKGSARQLLKVSLNANVSVGKKPDLTYDKKYLGAADYIAIEQFLFDNGYYDPILADQILFPAVSPVVDLLNKQRQGLLTNEQVESQLAVLRRNDLRDEYGRYLLRNGVSQQYAVNFSGGGERNSYYLGVGFDDKLESQVKNNSNRFTVTAQYGIEPLRNLELNAMLMVAEATSKAPNLYTWWNSIPSNYPKVYPYASLKDAAGNPLLVNTAHSEDFLDSLRGLGFPDWRFSPLEEINNHENAGKRKNLLMRAVLRYKFTNYLNAEIQWQYEDEETEAKRLYNGHSYYARNLVNLFAQYDPVGGSFTYPFPKGGILMLNNNSTVTNSFRGQLNFSRSLGPHAITALAGTEIRESEIEGYGRTSYGYDDEYGTAVSVIDYMTYFPQNGGWGSSIPAPPSNVNGQTLRFLSYYANASYVYDDKYALTVSGRKDGANIFGVRTNDRITPLWSAGLGWDIGREHFWSATWLPFLKLRATYGYNGNVYNGSAYLTATFNNVHPISNLPYGDINNAPNPDLRWEKSRQINFGVDFGLKDNRVSGTIEYFVKKGEDLIEDIPVANSAGFSTYRGNAAATRIKGIEARIETINTKGRVRWESQFLFNYMTDKITALSTTFDGRTLVSGGGLAKGDPVLSLYSFRWAGLDPTNGDPLGYVGKSTSNDYAGIVSTSQRDSLVLHGSLRPRLFGSLMNNISYRNFSLSFNILFKFDYYYRRKSVNTNYQLLFESTDGLHSDYSRRWQKAGDETRTDVPSLTYLFDDNRSTFYSYSEALVSRADHIRLQDINLTYRIGSVSKQHAFLNNLQIYLYAQNLGILWRANDDGLDPDYVNDYEVPKVSTLSVGIRTSF